MCVRDRDCGGSREGARVFWCKYYHDRRRGSPFFLKLAVRATSRVLVGAPGDAPGGQPRAPGLSSAPRTSSTRITTLHEGHLLAIYPNRDFAACVNRCLRGFLVLVHGRDGGDTGVSGWTASLPRHLLLLLAPLPSSLVAERVFVVAFVVITFGALWSFGYGLRERDHGFPRCEWTR
jgi:hypothetical protein